MEYIYSLILTYKYAILLPIAIVEGPITTIIGAFLASLGILDVYIVYVIAVLGNVIGDVVYYWIGRFGSHKFIPKYGHYVGVTESKIKYAEEHYRKHLGKTLFFGKITEAPIVAILIVAGATKVKFGRFLSMILLIEMPKMLVLTLIGFYFGKYYIQINQYLNTSVEIGLAAVVLGGLVYWFLIRKK